MSPTRHLTQPEAKKLLNDLIASGLRGVSGVTFPVRAKWPSSRISRVVFNDVDLASPLVGSALLRTAFEEVEFRTVSFDGVSCRKADFTRCLFTKVTFGTTSIGLFERCKFTACDFRDSDVGQITFQRSEIDGCNFERVQFRNTTFRQCKFNGSRFTGELESTTFIGCTFENTTFTDATLTDVAIIDTVGGLPLLPDRESNFVVAPQTLGATLPKLKAELSKAGFEAFSEIAESLAGLNGPVIVAPSLFDELDRADLARVLSVLFPLRERFGRRSDS